MKKILKQIQNVITYALAFIFIIADVFYGQNWAHNLMVFWTIVITLGSIWANSHQIEEVLQPYRDGHHFWLWLDWTLYLIIISILAGFGHWMLATGWTFIAAIDAGLRQKALKKVEHSK
jgi:hypothetical protein